MSLETSLSSLPLELLETIISFVPDQRSLASCALVCKLWVPAARAALFASLSLPNHFRTIYFLNLLDNDTPSTLVHARIKHLDLSTGCRDQVRSDSEQIITSWASRTPTNHAVLHEVFGHLTSMSVRFTAGWVTPKVPGKAWYSTITSLRLEFVNFAGEKEFQSLLRNCPDLESLELSSIGLTKVVLDDIDIDLESLGLGLSSNEVVLEDIDYDVDFPNTDSEVNPRLKSLSISYTYDLATLSLLAPFCRCLQKFEYDWHSQQYASAQSLPGIGAILHAAENTLEELSIKTGSWVEGTSFHQDIDTLFETHLELARFSSLRRLALDISTIYLLRILRRLASAYDVRYNRMPSSPRYDAQFHHTLPSITHLYIPTVGYKSSFKPLDPNSDSPLNSPTLLAFTNLQSQPTGSAPGLLQDVNQSLHEALETLLPIHPVFESLVELRCDSDHLFNAADFAVASSPQFFQSQYYLRMQAKQANLRSGTSPDHGGGSQPYSSFIPFTRSDNVLAMSKADAEADAEGEAEILAPTQFSLNTNSPTQRYPRPGTQSHSRLRLHIRKLKKHMPLCAAKGIRLMPVVMYWFNDVPTGLVAEERMWASGDGYAGPGGGNWKSGGGRDIEDFGGIQGLSMKGMEIWDAGKGKVLVATAALLVMAMLW